MAEAIMIKDDQTNAGVSRRNLLAVFAAVPLFLSAGARAQYPPLAPTSNTTIVVPTGVLHYSSIHVPAGVTVRFVALGFGPSSAQGMPAVVLCDGDAIVHGTLWLAGDPINDRPAGWVTIGAGSNGVQCGGTLWQPPGGGRHAGAYGTVLPFSLEGGSPGGWSAIYSDPGCTQYSSVDLGGEGGGTLVLMAGGRIEVGGTVTADGDASLSGGSGGSILLRGDAGVTVLPGGTVTARGGTAAPPPSTSGAPGHVRIDAWGAPPVLQGTVTPAPTVLELPYMRTQSPPTIGTTWILDIFAPVNSPIFVAASLQAGPGTATPFGVLGLDLVTAAGVALVVAQPGHDPLATAPWPVPNAPALIGLALWVQAFAVPPALPPRLTNTLAAVVG
jgi:hypothetical protein